MATSFGSITIVDITDVGEFSVSPSCNSALTIIYNEESDTYSPAWGGQGSVALEITPNARYAGSRLTADSYKWYRKEGSGTNTLIWDTTVTTATTANGESVINTGSDKGKLTVNQNQFNGYTQLTYIVEAYYTVTGIDDPLMAQGQITFSKITQNSDAKNINVTGTNAFIYNYNSSGTLVPEYNTVTLQGRKTSNLSFATNPWSYGYDITTMANNGGTPITDTSIYSTSGNFATLTAATTFLGNHNSVIFRLSSNDNNVYDLFTVYKLVNGKDGAPGDKLVTAMLDNDDQSIPFDKEGVGYYTDAVSTITIFEGNDDVTSDYNISFTVSNDGAATPTPTVKYTASNNNRTVTITEISAPTGYIIFNCIPKSTSGRTGTLTKKFSLIKVTAGEDGTDGETPIYYDLKASVLAVNATNTTNVDGSGSPVALTYTPSTIVFTAYKHEYNVTNSEWVQTVDTTNDIYIDGTKKNRESTGGNKDSVVVTLSGSYPNGKILAELHKGSTAGILDKQTVVITHDGGRGSQGEQGEDGDSAINLILGNEHQNFPTTAKKKTNGTISIEIPVELKLGSVTRNDLITTPSNVTLNLGGSTCTLRWNGTTKKFTGSINDNTTITNKSGAVSIVIPYNVPDNKGVATTTTSSATKTFTWATSASGTENVILQISTPDGTVFNNGTGSCRIIAELLEGNDAVTSGVTWEWYKYESGYQKITGASSSTYTVNAETVRGYISLQIIAKYDADGDGTAENYIGYVTLEDHGDNLQVTVHSTVGTQLVNGQGAGAIYAKVTFNGKQIDAIQNDIDVVDELPGVSDTRAQVIVLTVPAAGQSGSKTAVLYTHTTGNAWSAMDETACTAKYEWTFRNDQNQVVTGSELGIATTGKCLYVDGTVVSNKLTADVEVTYPKPNA